MLSKRWKRKFKEVRTIHDTYGIFRAVQRVANVSGLKLQQEQGCQQPCTDLETRVVFVEPLNPYWEFSRLMKWLGEVYHEVGHHSPEVIDVLDLMREKELSFNSLFGRMINLIDDYRQEKNGYGYYMGRDEALSWTQGYYSTKGHREVKAKGADESMQFFLDALGWMYAERAVWQPDVAIPAHDWEEIANWDRWSHLSEELNELDTAEDVYNLVIKMLDEDEDRDAQEEEEKSKEAAKSEESDIEDEAELSEGEEGEGEDGDEGEGSEDTEPDDGDGPETKGTVSYRDLMGDMHEDEDGKRKTLDAVKDHLSSITYDHDHARDYVPHPHMEVLKARDLPNRQRDMPEMIRDAYESGRKLAATARRLFQARTQQRISHNHRTGRLDKRDLYRIPVGDVDVFKRKDDQITTEGTAILVLTDASGSMGGRKFILTAAASALLNDAIGLFHIPLNITAFTEDGESGCRHFIVKDFAEKRKAEDIIEDYTKIAPELYQNADGESIMWAYHQLLSRPEKRKILIVLSDGEPACDNPGDCYTYTRDVLKHVEQHIECYGIGILDSTVSEFYSESTVLKRAEDLEQCLLDVIKTKLFT